MFAIADFRVNTSYGTRTATRIKYTPDFKTEQNYVSPLMLSLCRTRQRWVSQRRQCAQLPHLDTKCNCNIRWTEMELKINAYKQILHDPCTLLLLEKHNSGLNVSKVIGVNG